MFDAELEFWFQVKLAQELVGGERVVRERKAKGAIGTRREVMTRFLPNARARAGANSKHNTPADYTVKSGVGL